MPYKGEICAFRDDSYLGPILADFVLNFEYLCDSWIDEEGNEDVSQTQLMCDLWSDVCTNDIPSVTAVCSEPWNIPEDVVEAYYARGGSIYDFCYESQDFEDFDVESFCADDSDFADVCVDGWPDFVKVCDTEFPPGMFDGSNYEQVCELDIEDVCGTYPEICDEEAGTITSNLCGANEAWCDEDSEEYNHCAANLYDCMMDPDFHMCESFPDLCGY